MTLLESSNVPDTSSQEFSRANLFGMFLTLQLCQLTQPYGSLLFRGSSGFLWRVNPIASFVEALIIGYYLLKTIWQAWRDGHGFRRTPWAKILRSTASALLLLRGAAEDEDGGLMMKLMAASFSDGSQHVEAGAENEGATPSRTSGGQGAAEAQLEPVRMPDASESNEIGPTTTESDHQDPRTATAQQGVLRRRTSQLESAPPRRTDTITGPDPSSERSRLLRDAFGPNALAHHEMRIDIVTAMSVLFIFVKLLVVRTLWVFLTAAHFIVCGWLLVQSLLLIFHYRELSDLDMASSIRAARSLDRALKESSSWLWSIYVALHAPFLGYMCYVLVFQLELPHWVNAAVENILWIIAGVAGLGSFVLLIFGVLWLVYLICVRLLVSLCEGSDIAQIAWGNVSGIFIYGLIGVVLGSPLLLWTGLGCFTYYSKLTSKWNPDKYGSYTPIFGNSTMDIIVDSGFTKSVAGVWMLILFLILIMILCAVLLPYGARAQGRVSWSNFLLTVSVFIYYLMTYDARGSNKPAWTEYLG